MKTKSNEQFLAELKERRPNLTALEEYHGKEKPITIRCNLCGREWQTTPRNLLSPSRGTGCRKCSDALKKLVRRSKEQIQEELDSKNAQITIIGDYHGVRHETECMCLVCGYHWFPRLDHILEGFGCPKCRGAKQKTNDEFCLQLLKVNEYIIPITDYTNARTKILCKCKFCKYEWDAMPNHLLWGTGCPRCADRMKTSFSEQALYFYIQKVFKNAINRYKISRSNLELDVYIPDYKIGIEYDGIHWHKNKKELEEEKYKICKKSGISLFRVREGKEDSLSADEVIFRQAPYNFKTLDNVILNVFQILKINDVKIDTETDANKIRSRYYSELKENSLASKFPELVSEWYQEKNEDITPDMIPYGSNDKYWWKCRECGNIWKAQVCDRSIRGRGCKKCANIRNTLRMTKPKETLQKEIDMLNLAIDLIGEYQSTHLPIRVRCRNCGTEWDTIPTTLLRGRKCQVCAQKKPHTSVKKIHEEFIADAFKLNPNLVFIGKYDGNKSPIETKCKICGMTLKVRPADLYHGHFKKHLHI